MPKTPKGKRGDLVRIGEFARRSGTSLRTLRYYESLGLIRPAERSEGGFRYYRGTDVHRLHTIQSLQQLGLNLEQIRELLSARPEETPHREFVAHVRTVLQREDDLLQERMRELEERRERIGEALEKLEDCSVCGFHPGAENNYCEPCRLDGKPLPEDLSALF